MARSISIAILLGGALAGCGGRRDAGPAWPKLHVTETDGGESLAPQQGSSVAAIEEAKDAKPSAPAATAAAPTTAGAAPAATPATRTERPAADPPAAREPEVLTTEEIIIEIDD